jgi:hypothetical protein
MAGKTTTKTGMYAQRLLDNEYVQDNLAQAVESLRSAYRRASKRRVEPTRDEKLRRQVRQAALSIREAASALKAGRTKPKPRWGRRVIVVLAVGAGAAAIVIAKRKVLVDDDSDGKPGPQTTPTAGAQVPSIA